MYRPVITRSVAVGISASYFWWKDALLPTVPFGLPREFHYPQLSFGASAEFSDVLELGLSVAQDAEGGGWDAGVLFGLGPPYLRWVSSAGGAVAEGWWDDDPSRQSPARENGLLLRTAIRMVFPVETRKKPKTPPDPYDWWE